MGKVLSGLKRSEDPRLLVGSETSDDAGVFQLGPELALVQTVDFITPILDDPFAFGAVAAANSLSDVYAMGGVPVTALNIVCFPEDKLPIEILGEILKGGESKCLEAACAVAGGHTVVDPELKFGLSVTGIVHPDRILRNSTARAGDRLVLTKPLGTGILSTALKRGKLGDPEQAELLRSMSALNARAGAAAAELGASAATDITGFGLFGHAMEMARGSGTRIVLDAALLPLLPGVLEMARKGYLTGADRRNRDYVGARFRAADGSSGEVLAVGFDAQTSGGLLVSLAPAAAERFLARVPGSVAIGEVEPGPAEVFLRS